MVSWISNLENIIFILNIFEKFKFNSYFPVYFVIKCLYFIHLFIEYCKKANIYYILRWKYLNQTAHCYFNKTVVWNVVYSHKLQERKLEFFCILKKIHRLPILFVFNVTLVFFFFLFIVSKSWIMYYIFLNQFKNVIYNYVDVILKRRCLNISGTIIVFSLNFAIFGNNNIVDVTRRRWKNFGNFPTFWKNLRRSQRKKIEKCR